MSRRPAGFKRDKPRTTRWLSLARCAGRPWSAQDSVQPLETIRYNKKLYKQHSQIERVFTKIKDWRRVNHRYECYPEMFLSVCAFAVMVKILIVNFMSSSKNKNKKPYFLPLRHLCVICQPILLAYSDAMNSCGT